MMVECLQNSAAVLHETADNIPSFSKIASRLLKLEPEGILLIANSADAADLCQQIRKAASGAVILSSGWIVLAMPPGNFLYSP
jgi:hypothetical protein